MEGLALIVTPAIGVASAAPACDQTVPATVEELETVIVPRFCSPAAFIDIGAETPPSVCVPPLVCTNIEKSFRLGC